MATPAEILAQAANLARENRGFALVHLVRVKGSSPGKSGFLMLVTPEAAWGTIGGGDAERQMIEQAREAVREGRSRTVNFELSTRAGNLVKSLCGGTNEVFIEVFMPRPCLLLLGAGHVSRAVAKLCELLDYPYVVLDDRREYAKPAYFKGALEVVCARGDKYFARKPRGISHVIGLGYDAEFDLDGLIPALKKLPAHTQFGTIGSKPKFAKMTALARKRGVSAKQWARVKCPVGMAIGAQTPAEIAVAIMAEVVAGLPGRASHGWK